MGTKKNFLPGTVGLAPMAGVTDYPFRKICFELGAKFAFTEMISAKSVLLNISVNEKYFPKEDEKHLVGVQLFGSDPFELAQAAALVEGRGLWVDLNAGCPVAKVVKRGAGSALLKDIEHFRKVVREMRRVVKRLSVKTRIGWEKDEFEKIYDALVSEGVDIIFVHGRTAKQMYSGKAKWDIYNPGIVPLYISGDIYTVDDIKRAMELSGADGVIVARGAIGNPWIFSENRDSPSLDDKLRVILKHIDLLREEYGKDGVVEFRKFVAGYTKDMPHAREFRNKVMKITDVNDLKDAFVEYFTYISQHNRASV
ncbi:tRNA-dihydrouridine synthase [Fervidobacterium pennivorans subsp. shakshaketiis]|uniref:tRNA dihydrouridine synthase n=1 Tax=Fervidobacterium pennivorans TaxID=93466 RepID=UPI00355C2356